MKPRTLILLAITLIAALAAFAIGMSQSQQSAIPTLADLEALTAPTDTLTPTLTLTASPMPSRTPTEAPRPTRRPQVSSCPSSSPTCGSLSSCSQARACLAAGHRHLDRDRDGIPCESLCG
jgi:hypothetical protein